ncbi:MAG: DoxX family membrane protein, partial [Kiritimatiellae bacterium]|nr:DoxX family membrane protein [Kiritimatiellia bacterium]
MNRRILMQGLEFVCRLGLGALFIYSALAKISDPDEFAYSVSRYEMLPGFTIGLFSLTMPMLELLAGVAMLFTKWLRESALLVSGMLAMFIVALTQALVRGLDISCGCFGVPSVGGQREIVMALVRDVV